MNYIPIDVPDLVPLLFPLILLLPQNRLHLLLLLVRSHTPVLPDVLVQSSRLRLISPLDLPDSLPVQPLLELLPIQPVLSRWVLFRVLVRVPQQLLVVLQLQVVLQMRVPRTRVSPLARLHQLLLELSQLMEETRSDLQIRPTM